MQHSWSRALPRMARSCLLRRTAFFLLCEMMLVDCQTQSQTLTRTQSQTRTVTQTSTASQTLSRTGSQTQTRTQTSTASQTLSRTASQTQTLSPTPTTSPRPCIITASGPVNIEGAPSVAMQLWTPRGVLVDDFGYVCRSCACYVVQLLFTSVIFLRVFC